MFHQIERPSLIEMREICKFFPSNGVTALDNAGFTAKSGEIHALLGENGAGKSTLMQILAGFLPQDSGIIRINGMEKRFRRPVDALACRIGMVRQRPELTPGLAVWEDCVLGAETEGGGIVLPYRQKARARVEAANNQWEFGLSIDAQTETLSAAERQKAAILALLLRGADFLIFDEPTAVLGETDSEKLFALWKRLAGEGKGIILISHKLEETLALADSITVLRRGKNAASCQGASCSQQQILEVMFGEQHTESSGERPQHKDKNRPQDHVPDAPSAPPLLEVAGLSVREAGFPLLRGLDLTVRRGEIAGIAGVKESGTETLELALTGFIKKPLSGTIRLDGVDITGKGSAAFRQAGGAYLGAGRKSLGAEKGLASSDSLLSIRDNLLIHAHRRLYADGFLGKLKLFNGKKVHTWLEHIMKSADLSCPAQSRCGTLSGGMLQRLLGVREFAENPKIVVFSEPAWGLDRQRRDRFFRFLRERANEGRGIILFFSNIDEILAVADKILVLRNGAESEIIPLEDKTCAVDTPELIKRVQRAMAGFKAAG